MTALHSTFFDTIACVWWQRSPRWCQQIKTADPSARETPTVHTAGACDPRRPNSRQNTQNEILRQVTSQRKWPQILIFPEGVCTNHTCLITFKLGDFCPGIPEEAVLLRYPNPLNTVTCTWQGFTGFQVFVLTLSQLFTRVEVAFMPGYIPNDQEKNIPSFLPVLCESTWQMLWECCHRPYISRLFRALETTFCSL